MKQHLIFFIIIILIANTLTSIAQNPDTTATPGFWDYFGGDIKLSFEQRTGNVEKTNMKYEASFAYERQRNQISIKSNGVMARKAEETFQESYYASILDVWRFGQRSGWYGKASFYTDEFKGYEEQWKIGTGYLFDVVQRSKTFYFKTRIGYQARFSNVTKGNDRNENLGMFGFRAGVPIMESITLSAEMNYSPDFSHPEENYYVDGYIKANFEVNRYVDFHIKYWIDYENVPVFDRKPTDAGFETSLILKISPD